MKPSILAAGVIALAATFQPALAQTSKPPDTAAAQTQPLALNPADFDKQLAQAQEYMKQMQAQMDRVAKTQDAHERQRLLQEHWTSMQAAMSVMHGMWGYGGAGCCGGGPATMGPGMMGGPMMGGPMMGWGQMRGYYSGLTPEQLRQRQYMVDQYLPMQQMMIDHMMWHQRWIGQQPPATTR